MATISREDLKAKIERGDDFVLVEVLPEMYYRHTHLPGAINMPPAQFEQLMPRLLPDKNMSIVVYCADLHCELAPQAVAKLSELGYTNAVDYAAGKADWVAAGLPTEGRSRAHRELPSTS
jgi:rhodanese-related sulfurtransferase